MTLFPELDNPPLVARPACDRRTPYSQVAAMVRQLREAKTDDQRCLAASQAVYLLQPDELSATVLTFIDFLGRELPEGWE